MAKVAQSDMAEALRDNHRYLGERLRRGLLNFGVHQEMNLDQVVKIYRRSPQELEKAFLRTPGCGRKTWEELIDFCEGYPDDGDFRGRTIAIGFTEAAAAQSAIAEACHYVAVDTPMYKHLRNAQHWLDAATIHVEQLEDSRSIF